MAGIYHGQLGSKARELAHKYSSPYIFCLTDYQNICEVKVQNSKTISFGCNQGWNIFIVI